MSCSEKLLIVNADDFNLTEGINRGILEAHDDGIVTSTTVVVNLPLKKKWAAIIKGKKSLGVGLHLNIVIGEPVSSLDRVPSLVNKEGRFRWRQEVLKAPYPLGEIKEEFEAQLKLFGKIFSRPPTHIDTHYHIHAEREIFTLILELSCRYKLPFRLSPSLSGGERALLEKQDIILPDYFFGDVSRNCWWTPARLQKTLSELPNGVSEIMVHPGYSDQALAKQSSLNKQRVRELKLLCSHSIRLLVEQGNIQLIHYGMLRQIKRHGKMQKRPMR